MHLLETCFKLHFLSKEIEFVIILEKHIQKALKELTQSKCIILGSFMYKTGALC